MSCLHYPLELPGSLLDLATRQRCARGWRLALGACSWVRVDCGGGGPCQLRMNCALRHWPHSHSPLSIAIQTEHEERGPETVRMRVCLVRCARRARSVSGQPSATPRERSGTERRLTTHRSAAARPRQHTCNTSIGPKAVSVPLKSTRSRSASMVHQIRATIHTGHTPHFARGAGSDSGPR